MQCFQRDRPPKRNEVPVSIKIRIVSGCFHREHSPRAYEIIDAKLSKLPRNVMLGFEEHESGPELLVYVAAGVALTTSVINLVTAIIKARSEGVKKKTRSDGQRTKTTLIGKKAGQEDQAGRRRAGAKPRRHSL